MVGQTMLPFMRAGIAAGARGAGLRWRPQSVKRFEALTEPTGETSPLFGAQRRKTTLTLGCQGGLLRRTHIRGLPPYRSAPLVN